MAVTLRDKTWNLMLRPFGKQIRIAVPDCETKRAAIALESQILEALLEGKYANLTGPARKTIIRIFINQKWEMPEELMPKKAKPPVKEFTLWQAAQLYVNDPSFKCLNKPERIEQQLVHIVKFFKKSKPLKEIWIPDLKLYRSHRTAQGRANATINREMSTMSGVFRVAVEHQLVDVNPCRLLRRLSEKDSQRQVYISYADTIRIMDQCPDWYHDIIWIGFLSGMRQGEIHKLRWSHIDLRSRIISFHGTEVKEGKAKRVPVHRELIPLFERVGKIRSLNDDRLFNTSNQSLRLPWTRALDKLQWPEPRPRFHDIRHTFKTNCRRSGIDSEIRESILGHSNRSLDVSERYGVISDEELVSAIDRFTYDHGLTQILVAPKAGK
jgi:integrase